MATPCPSQVCGDFLARRETGTAEIGHDGAVKATTLRPLADRLRSATSTATDPAGVARAVFAGVARDVSFSFACLATTDPTSGLITGAFKSSPLPLGDEEFAAAEYGEPDLNQFSDVAGRSEPVGVLSVDTDGHPERCRRLREYMTPQFGFVDEIGWRAAPAGRPGPCSGSTGSRARPGSPRRTGGPSPRRRS